MENKNIKEIEKGEIFRIDNKEFMVIIERILKKIEQKPDFYHYYSKKIKLGEYKRLIKEIFD